MNILKKYIDWKNRYELGEAHFSFFKNLAHLESVVLVLALIALYFPALKELALILTIPIVASIVVLSYITGYFMDKKIKLVHAQASWGNQRNPELQDIIRRLRVIEQKL